MDIAGFVAAVQAQALALSGMKAAPATPPETLNQFPIAISYPLQLDAVGGPAGMMKRIVTVVCEIHVGRLLLPTAVALATPYGDSFPAALWADPRLGGAVNHINAIRGAFVQLVYGGTSTIGWRFEIEAKIEGAV